MGKLVFVEDRPISQIDEDLGYEWRRPSLHYWIKKQPIISTRHFLVTTTAAPDKEAVEAARQLFIVARGLVGHNATKEYFEFVVDVLFKLHGVDFVDGLNEIFDSVDPVLIGQAFLALATTSSRLGLVERQRLFSRGISSSNAVLRESAQDSLDLLDFYAADESLN